MSRFEITKGKAALEGYPDPIWWAMAARQIGLVVDVEPVLINGEQGDIWVRLPELSPATFWEVQQRAEKLAERDAQGLPTEERPSGGFPDSEDEVTDPIALNVGKEDGQVVLDFGRAIRAVRLHPVAASYLGSLLTQTAFEASPAMRQRCLDMTPTQVQVAHVKGADGVVREAALKLGDLFTVGEQGAKDGVVTLETPEDVEREFGGGG